MAEEVEPKKVVPLRVVPAGPAEVNPNVVETLEELLDQAKKGQVDAFVAAISYANEDIETLFIGETDWHKMIAITSIMQHRLLNFHLDVVEEDEEG